MFPTFRNEHLRLTVINRTRMKCKACGRRVSFPQPGVYFSLRQDSRGVNVIYVIHLLCCPRYGEIGFDDRIYWSIDPEQWELPEEIAYRYLCQLPPAHDFANNRLRLLNSDELDKPTLVRILPEVERRLATMLRSGCASNEKTAR